LFQPSTTSISGKIAEARLIAANIAKLQDFYGDRKYNEPIWGAQLALQRPPSE
jgi:hypothetical protein